jgi:hypothetical protein
MYGLDARTLSRVIGGAFGDAVTQDPQYQRELLACWERADQVAAPAARADARAACLNRYYDTFWANRSNPPP